MKGGNRNLISWGCKKFEELTPFELYDILRLRNEIFVVEQNCVFQDADNKDQHCHHLLGWHEKDLAAYARLLPPGLSYKEMSIGRVACAFAFRGNGTGRELMTISIEHCDKLFGKGPIKLGGQLYLKGFYESLGFRQKSEIYLEDGIEHIEMILSRG
jgi:ElaA protein